VIVHAQALRAADRHDDALRALDNGMARLGALPSLQLPAIDIETERQRYAQALTRLDVLLRQVPNNEAWRMQRAELLQRLGRNEEARDELARALQLVESRPSRRRSKATQELAARLRNELNGATARREGQP